MIYYEPSCKVRTAHPESSLKMQCYLRNKGIIVTGCCRPSQSFYKDGDTVLYNCTSCAIIVTEASPQVKSMSLYEYLLYDTSFPWPDFHGERITVQDCWRARLTPAVQLSVRKCMEKMNIEPVELESENFHRTIFDGPFNLMHIAQRNLDIAPKTFSKLEDEISPITSQDEIKKRMAKQVAKYTTDRTVVYCSSCEKGIRMGGGNPVHIIELLTDNL